MDTLTPEQNLAGQSRWILATILFNRVLQLATSVVLLRLLSPDVLGVYVIAATVFTLVAMFADLGIPQALIQRPGSLDSMMNSSFSMLLISSSLVFGLVFFSAPLAGQLFHDDSLVGVIRVLGARLLLLPFLIIHGALFVRQFRFRLIFGLNILLGVVASALSIALAFKGLGVWALIAGDVVAQVIYCIAIWLFVPLRLKFHLSRLECRRILAFGLPVSVESFFGWLIINIERLFMGRYLSASQVGLYKVGYDIALSPLFNLTVPFLDGIYATFCKIHEEAEQMRRFFLASVHYISYLNVLIASFLVWNAKDVVVFLFGPKWVEAAPTLVYLAIFGAIAAPGIIPPQAYKAMNRPGLNPKFLIVQFICVLPFLFLASRRDIVSVAQVHVAQAVLFVSINLLLISRKILGFSIRQLTKALRGPILTGIGIVGINWLMDDLFTWHSSAFGLGPKVAVSVAFALGMAFWLDRDTVRTFRQWFRGGQAQKVLDQPLETY